MEVEVEACKSRPWETASAASIAVKSDEAGRSRPGPRAKPRNNESHKRGEGEGEVRWP